jgi:hypothetical protein
VYKFSQDLVNKLLSFNQRKLTKGEIFLLAKSIADELPLLPPDEDNVNLFILNHKRFIDEVIWCLNNYTYLDKNEIKTVNKLISDLTLWRASIAYNPPITFFKDCPNSVIDDISSLPRFVDLTYMCAVGDIINNANYIADLFRTFVKEIKKLMVVNSDSLSTEKE